MTLGTDAAGLRTVALQELSAISTLAEAVTWERTYLGPKGEVTRLLRGLGELPADQRPDAGRAAQELRSHLQQRYSHLRGELTAAKLQTSFATDTVDVTLPGRQPNIGVDHPISAMIEELSEIFALMGFQTIFGPEVETGHYNFDLLNIPSDHPARDVWDTIFIESDEAEILLRTHTSPMQVRVMEATTPPVRVIVPGRTYRYEAQDASHEWMFHQLEGLAVDETITMADLKACSAKLLASYSVPTEKCDFVAITFHLWSLELTSPSIAQSAMAWVVGSANRLGG